MRRRAVPGPKKSTILGILCSHNRIVGKRNYKKTDVAVSKSLTREILPDMRGTLTPHLRATSEKRTISLLFAEDRTTKKLFLLLFLKHTLPRRRLPRTN